jgi:hypothetical protein
LKYTPHHVGCAVPDLENSCGVYAAALGLHRRTRAFDVVSQGVRVCFLEMRAGFYLELVMQINEKARLGTCMKVGFYHLCMLVEDLETARQHLKALQFAPLPSFSSEAFAGAPCQFFFNPQRHLIEVAQISTAAFEDFFHANLHPGERSMSVS